MGNSADALLAIIHQIRDPKYKGSKAKQIWTEVLELNGQSTSELYRGIASVIELPDVIQNELISIGYPVETIKPSFQKINHVFNTMDFSSQGAIFAQHINDDVVRSLEQVKWIIENPNLTNFDKEAITTLNGLCEELKGLFENISNVEDIDAELKQFLDIYIAQLIMGIEEYFQSNDINKLKMAATSAFSVLGLEKSILKSAQSTDEGRAFRTVLFKLMEFIGYGNDIKQLADNIKLLTESTEVVSTLV
ncbi:hypothetical protein [Vibrio parahaemolyticus]|uniref:hypothetical protein n=1 Tax=Vibrio parahaemolyticus TaxID=670 RepID=UPI003891F683